MKNRCKLNPCCGDPYDCVPPDQYDGYRWDAEKKCWIPPAALASQGRSNAGEKP